MSCDMQPCEACICIQEFPGLPHKSPHTAGLKQQKFSLSTFWRLEICNQGVNKAMFPLQALGKDPSLPLIASGSCQESLEVLDLEASSLQYLPPSSSGLPPSMCVSLGLHILHMRMPATSLRAHPTPLWLHHNLTNYMYKSSNKITFWGSEWAGILRGYYSTQYNRNISRNHLCPLQLRVHW